MTEGKKHVRKEIVPVAAPSSLIKDKDLPERNGYAIIEGAVDPHDGMTWDIRMSRARMEAVAKRGLGPTKELAYIVPLILRSPTAIFQGVREDGESEWLCYCGQPNYSFHRVTGDRGLAHEDEIYLVFVNADRVAYADRWEECDPNNPKFPKAINERFERRIL